MSPVFTIIDEANAALATVICRACCVPRVGADGPEIFQTKYTISAMRKKQKSRKEIEKKQKITILARMPKVSFAAEVNLHKYLDNLHKIGA